LTLRKRNASRMLFCAIAVMALLSVPALNADVPDSQQHEVLHLLEFVRTTSCRLERNGKQYNGAEAFDHIQKKYRHFRDEITNTEQFIEKSATRSAVSGAYYYIHCGGNNRKTGGWLLDELARYRQAHGE